MANTALPFKSPPEPELLARYQRILDCLDSLSGAVPVDRLADELLALEPAADVERIRIRLHHSDLPRLEDTGVLSYDRTRRHVRLLE
ncbi:DUF7344 domain-containing protein [Natronorubrum texcoconense]|nr:hypothetical protein [Natronorubrum texcoconense]